jgi:hypothetical protein
MPPKRKLHLSRLWLALLFLGASLTAVCGLLSFVGLRLWQSTPAYQFAEARRRWEARHFQHYHMMFDSGFSRGGYAACLHDVEVLDEKVVKTYATTCLSSHTTQSLSVTGIFETFERYLTNHICSATGCYCEGIYVLKATYDPELGYPQTITTEFRRNLLDDLTHDKLGVQDCFRSDPTVELIKVISLTALP